MFLKSLVILGFKSFADKTEIVFKPGITSVVGPNGCGKSNIVDSIKWVLGEKRAKNIRGERMEDIIFNGTDLRKPLSLAEVSLTVNNSDGVLDFNSSSVVITRRIFRDGESEYFINNSAVRLKDIEQLFLDTGIGKSAYSVMEQGKIDLILSTKAEDRRYLFEEAAGIARYKLQKKESLSKLEATRNNLDRINDIIIEIGREKEIKAKQAEKTKIYLSLRKEHIDFDIRFHLFRYNDLLKKKEKVERVVEKLQQDREKIASKVLNVSVENEKDEKWMNDLQLQLFELDKKLHAYRIKVEDVDKRIEKNHKLIVELKSRKDITEKKRKERVVNLDRLKTETEKTVEDGKAIFKMLEDDKVRLRNFFEIRKNKINSITTSRNKIENKKKEIESKEIILKKLRDSLEVVIKKLIDAIEKRKEELIVSENERQGVRDDIYNRIEFIDNSIQEVKRSIHEGRFDEAVRYIHEIDIKLLKGEILRFENYEDGFRSILFDKTGIHADKEELDKQINIEIHAINNFRSEIKILEEYIDDEQNKLEDVNSMITKVEKDISRNESEKSWIERHLKSLGSQIKDIENQIENFIEDISRSDIMIKNFLKEIGEWEGLLVESNERIKSLMKRMDELKEKRKEIEKEIFDRRNVSRRENENLKNIVSRIVEKEKSFVELNFKMNNIEEYLWTEYEKKSEDLKSDHLEIVSSENFQRNIKDIKNRIKDLGPINNLAIQEHEELAKRYKYYTDQRSDIEKARKDITSVIEKINITSIEMFIKTFNEISKNLSKIFKQLFNGGEATVELTDENNVLESGINILARPPGKKLKSIDLLSGGERTLTAIALMFSTYMVKPSPFCFLDEIDAMLDEENIGRFAKMLKEFDDITQFIIVTHNKKTMSVCSSIYGITMEEPGVSKVVSLKMKEPDESVV